ncbi:MAG: PA2169 family four-helix-bundle protein [Pyrinomonadaceae bacterium]
MINDYEATTPIVPEGDLNTNATPTAATNDEVISTLNGLIQTLKDGQLGFKTASEDIERSELKTTFYEFSQQRSEFTGVLQELVRSLGGDPENAGSISGAVHRGWMDLKSAVTGRTEEAILNECERGEDYAKEAYADAEQKNLPANIADVIAQQAQAIQAAHNRVKALRDAERAESSKAATPGIF